MRARTLVPGTGHRIDVDAGNRLASDALRRADASWLARLITRRVPLGSFAEALAPSPDDIKVVLTIDE